MTPTLLDIVVWPDDRLTQMCEYVTEFDDDLKQLSVDMAHTMDHRLGIGLAAPQVGVNIKMIVAILQELSEPVTLINPTLTEVSDVLFEWDEGCLSVPGYYEFRKRPSQIVVQYQDLNGDEQEIRLRGLFAFLVQHEMDHLDGKLFIDDLSPFKKSRIQVKIKKALKQQPR